MVGRRVLLVVCFLAAGTLSGCVGGDDPDEVITPPDVPGEPEAEPEQESGAIGAPAWNVGDYWVYDNGDGGETILVVVEATPTDWMIGTASETSAFFDALFDISTLGPQRRSDLAGSQGSTRVEFFRFPLVDGATWTATWDDAPRTIQVTAGPRDLFSFEATSEDGSLFATYTYDPEAKWFRTLDFFEPDGTPQWSNTLRESGEEWTGEILRYGVDEVFQRDSSTEATPQGMDLALVDFTQEAGHTDVFLAWDVVCSTGHFFFSVVPGESTGSPGFSSNDPCPKEEHVFQSLGSAPGDWGITVAKATGADTAWSATVYLRTLERIAFA